LRIIAGKYKSRRVYSSPADFKSSVKKNTGGYRPTSDRAKESLFNVLNNIIDFDRISCLDLFAGSGSLGFEALSRGAASCDFVEISDKQIKLIEKTAKELKVEQHIRLYCNNAISFLGQNRSFSYDLIFADPPYQFTKYEVLLSKVFDINFGIFVLEHPADCELLYDTNRFDVISRTVGTTGFKIFSSKDE
jgi:16S rRNA (guanine(966)-N(2))-methyltransferase RsmD